MDIASKAESIAKIAPNADVEICGTWVWIEFDGKPSAEVREKLKELGCMWAPKKQKWYWRPPAARRYFARGNTTMDEIRTRYGSESVSR